MNGICSQSLTQSLLANVCLGDGEKFSEVQLIDNFTNKKEMTSHCYIIAYRSMERSLMDEEINELQTPLIGETNRTERSQLYPSCYKDSSFWINESFTENNLCEVVRGIAGDLAEEVLLIDNFTNKKGMSSHCYMIAYGSMERSLTN
ncbi:phenylalanine--trna ligase, partial [Quercus suber]